MTPLVLSESEFLCGATQAEPYSCPRFEYYIGDICKVPEPGTLVAIESHPGYYLAHSSDSVLLLHDGAAGLLEVVGYYNTPGAVCIRDDHQGKGLGAELILHTAIEWCGGPPTAALDEQSFSKAGLAAHRAAWRLGCERGLIVAPEMATLSRRACA